jgi:hypothetical protein
MSGNVCQSVGTAASGNVCFSQTEDGSNPRTITFTGNIILPNAAGDQTGIVAFMATNPVDTYLPYAVVEHNTVFTGTHYASSAGTGVLPEETGYISSFRSNLFYATSTTAGAYVIIENYSNPTQYPDPVSGAHADYNGAYQVPLVPANTWAAPNNAANGTLYDLPMTTTPGVHDVIGVNPLFVDNTRTIQSWDASLGGAGTLASALARIQANPSLTKSSLIPYIRAGFLPTNTAYIGTAHDGTNIGAV